MSRMTAKYVAVHPSTAVQAFKFSISGKATFGWLFCLDEIDEHHEDAREHKC